MGKLSVLKAVERRGPAERLRGEAATRSSTTPTSTTATRSSTTRSGSRRSGRRRATAQRRRTAQRRTTSRTYTANPRPGGGGSPPSRVLPPARSQRPTLLHAGLNPPLPEGKGIPGSGCLLEQRSRRSCAIGTSRVETSPDEHHACGVLVPWGHGSARGAGVGAFTQRQCVLGSRIAAARSPSWCARGGPGGRPARACGPSRSGPVLVAPMAASAALRAMVVLARNFGRKSSTAMASWSRTTFLAHLRPVSCTLPGDLLVRLRPQLLRLAVALRPGPALLAACGGPSSGRTGSASPAAFLPCSACGQVVRVGRGGRGLPHAPVDAESRGRSAAGAGPGRGRRTSRTSARGCPGTRAPRTARPAGPATTPPSRRCRPPGAAGRPSAGTRAWCSSGSAAPRASSSTSASRPGAAWAGARGCPCAPWRGSWPKSRMTCCWATEEPSRSHGVRARASVSILSSCAGPHVGLLGRWPCCAGVRPWTWRHTRSTPTGTGPTPPPGRCGQWTTRAAGTCTGHARPPQPPPTCAISPPHGPRPGHRAVPNPAKDHTYDSRTHAPRSRSHHPDQRPQAHAFASPRRYRQRTGAPRPEPDAATLRVATPGCDSSPA